jgi:two-component system response regulator
MDGMQVIRTIRENEEVRRLPIIVISAGGEDAQYEAFKAGADLFLGKPVRLPQLFQSLQLLLDLESHGEKESS